MQQPLPSTLPVYDTDTPLAFLGTAELLLTAATRLWMAHYFDPQGGHKPWRGGFEAAQVDLGAIFAFDEFWRTVAVAPKKQLDLRCPACPALGEDEGLFLQAVQALQNGRRGLAQALMASWMPPSALRLARTALEIVAGSFQAVGLALPDRHALPAGPRGATAIPCPDRGLALIH